MFNWFKSKIELKNENSIMSSVYYKNGLKVGSEINVPNNFKCLIYNNGRHYFSFESGKHKVSIDSFATLINAQQKAKRKTKHVKCVCHYINLGSQSMKIKFKKQKFLVKFVIVDISKFVELVLLYTYKVDNSYTETNLFEMFCELLSWHKGDYSQISKTALAQYGLEINEFSPIKDGKKSSIFDNDSSEKVGIFEQTAHPTNITPSNKDNTETEQTYPTTEISPSQPKTSVQANTCPRCGNISKFNTTYCLKCGYKLE